MKVNNAVDIGDEGRKTPNLLKRILRDCYVELKSKVQDHVEDT